VLALRPVLALALAVLAGLALLLGALPLWAGGAYLALGLISALTYRADKQAARAREWRVPEARLHGLDLVGGIIGGLLAQQMLRHKTSKSGFAAITVLIALAHGLGLLALMLLGPLPISV